MQDTRDQPALHCVWTIPGQINRTAAGFRRVIADRMRLPVLRWQGYDPGKGKLHRRESPMPGRFPPARDGDPGPCARRCRERISTCRDR